MGRKKPERKPINCLLPYFLHCSSTEIFIFFPIANFLLSAISFSKYTFSQFWQSLHFVFSFTSVFFYFLLSLFQIYLIFFSLFVFPFLYSISSIYAFIFLTFQTSISFSFTFLFIIIQFSIYFIFFSFLVNFLF